MTAAYHLVQSGLVVIGALGPVFIRSSDPRWQEAIAFIKGDDLQGLADWLAGKPEPDDGFLRVDGEVVPADLKKQFEALRKAGLPTRPVLKFWERLRKNPSINSRRQLYRFLEAHQIPITTSGLLICYRGVTKGFKDMHTGTFDNSVGKVVRMPRDKVNDDPDHGCSTGLHVANFRYAQDFASGGHLVEVLVDPEHVVSVPKDSDFEKIRVCEFKVLRVISSENKSLVVTLEDESVESSRVLDSGWDQKENAAAPTKRRKKAKKLARVIHKRKAKAAPAKPKSKRASPKTKVVAKRAKRRVKAKARAKRRK